MEIGLLAFSSDTGLGYQTRDFYKHIPCSKVLIVDISKLNNMPVDHSWIPSYEDFRVTDGIPTDEDVEWLVDGMDAVFLCETPLNYHLFEYAKEKGVATINQYNYEFLEHFRTPNLPMPTVLASPSTWGIERVKEIHDNVVLWSVPMDTKGIKFRKLESLNTFIHVLGRPAANDRNGTLIFIEAAKRLGKKYTYKIYLQSPKELKTFEHYEPIAQAINEAQKVLGDNLQVYLDTENNLDMYKFGDVLVLPRRYGGLCLPMWESLASGVPVIMPDISPNNSILPKEWLVEAEVKGSFQTSSTIDLYETNIDRLVEVMENMRDNITEYNIQAREIAESNSWDAQQPIILERFKKICG